MEKKNFLFVSIDGLTIDTAWQVVKEGHEVRYFTENPDDKEVGDGFVPKVDTWEEEVDWADVIVFDDVLGQGKKAKKLRQQGKPVIGGTPHTDRLEDDRAFGQEELKKAGVQIIPYKDFSSFDDAIVFVQENPGKYVIKPSGEAAQQVKRFLFVGEEDDGKDTIQVLEAYKKVWSRKMRLFQLQKRVSGVEVAVGAFFNGKEFIYPINVNFEHKKLFPGNIGPSTGEMGCYDEQTEVLTDKGWRYFWRLDGTERLCTLNPINNEIEYHVPEVIVSFSHHKKLVHIQNQTVDICVTPDHNMWVCPQSMARTGSTNYQFVKASKLQAQCKVKRTGVWQGVEQRLFVLPGVPYGHYEGRQVVMHKAPEIQIAMDDWVSFLGIYIAEGSVSSNKVSLAQSKPCSSRIRALLARLPFRFSERNNEFYSYDKQLAAYLGRIGKAPDKVIPQKIKSLCKRQLSLFLDWFALGDATRMKSGHRIFCTSSRGLAGDIQELLLKIGRMGVVKARKRKGPLWIVNHWADSSRIQYEVHERIKKGDSWLDKRDRRIVPYNGRVYCATVRNHIMYVRRNGKPFWCGNTSMFWSGPNKIFNMTLKKVEPKLAEEGYVGYVDINCIVNNNGIYPLEWTARFGYPTISIQQEGMLTPIGEFLYELAKGNTPTLKTRSGFQIGVRIVVPPFPFKDKKTFESQSKDSVIIFKKPNKEGVHLEDVKLENDQWVVTGSSGVILIVCGTGQTMTQAQRQVYSRIKNIIIPHMYYRKDIGDRWIEDSDKLHNWSYLRD